MHHSGVAEPITGHQRYERVLGGAFVLQHWTYHHPTFLWYTTADMVVPSQDALRFALALADQRAPYELHVFECGAHGLSLADETSADDPRLINPEAQVWIDLAFKWLTQQQKHVQRRSEVALSASR
ncbi:hypothetical protein [Deinococcus humi]|uniref:Acetyl esterase/lipase n=1 Tax=Deinococcus humi TaxID=662880 RepID=A0A7W8JWR5_9DEIO|nr:hypothetical protein [Deinococcus humi]MBB5364549.1 acetyl esterase/lipase [Deinococcus humi]